MPCNSPELLDPTSCDGRILMTAKDLTSSSEQALKLRSWTTATLSRVPHGQASGWTPSSQSPSSLLVFERHLHLCKCGLHPFRKHLHTWSLVGISWEEQPTSLRHQQAAPATCAVGRGPGRLSRFAQSPEPWPCWSGRQTETLPQRWTAAGSPQWHGDAPSRTTLAVPRSDDRSICEESSLLPAPKFEADQHVRVKKTGKVKTHELSANLILCETSTPKGSAFELRAFSQGNSSWC